MRHKLSDVVYSQGWLGAQLEAAAADVKAEEKEDSHSYKIAEQVLVQWKVLDEALDDLIKERQEMERQLSIVQSAFTK